MTISPVANIKIVAIDDEAASLELIADALSQPGVDVLTAADPNLGWDIVRREHPDIVLLDLRRSTSLVDYFVIATAPSRRQANAIVSEIAAAIERVRG